MSGYTRGSTLRGPAIITLGTTQIRAKDIKVNMGFETFNVPSEISERADERITGVPVTIEFTPIGVITAGIITALWGNLSSAIGTELFGTSDTACIITPLTGLEQITFHCAAITKMPDIIISATKTSIGSMVITCILKNATEWTDAAARLTVAASVSAPSSALDMTTIPTNAARIQWGEDSPWTTLQSREGVTVSFNMATDNDITDEFGLVGMALAGIDASAKFSPMGCNVTQALTKLALQGTGVARGTSLAGRAEELTVQSALAGGLEVVIPTAALKNMPLLYGRTSPRFSDFELVSLPTTGVVATVGLVE
jgi:hypothetical protein